jgi:hypothetical protein
MKGVGEAGLTCANHVKNATCIMRARLVAGSCASTDYVELSSRAFTHNLLKRARNRNKTVQMEWVKKNMRQAITKIMILSVALLMIPLLASHATPTNGAEDTLQEWFMSNGYSINVTSDEMGIDTFPAGSYAATILAEIGEDPMNNSFGWYVEINQTEEVFAGLEGQGAASDFTVNETFGVYLYSVKEMDGYLYSQNSSNPDGFDHLWVFLDPKTPGGYILAWEDWYDGGDQDYQDTIISLRPALLPITSDVNVDPDSLNVYSRGRWITCYIELPENYSVSEINVTSILLNQTISAEAHPTGIGDEDDDGILDLMVKFNRTDVKSLVMANTSMASRFTEVVFTITGCMQDGILFQGSDTTRIISRES